MKPRGNDLLKAVRIALYASTSAVVALTTAPAFAQSGEAGSERLETVVVTGSRIRRVDIESASPVFSIDKVDIARSGKLTIGDLIQESPSISGAATNPSVNNGGGDGAATVSLRGLGSQRTLLLINGRRMNYADVNSIPIAMVERVDILKDGASAIYGSDAVAGVVNFVLRKDYQGIEATADYGISDADDGERKGFTLTMGHSTDRGNITVGANYNKQEPVWAGDRKFSAPALYNYFGEIEVGGSSYIPTGRFSIPRAVARNFGINCPGTGASVNVMRIPGAPGTNAETDFKCYGGGPDSYDYSLYNLELTPQERGGVFVTGSYRITDNVEAFVEGFSNKTRSRYIIAPLPLIFGQAGVNLSQNSVYNPFYDPTVDLPDATVRSGGIRMTTAGNREGFYETQSDQMTGGLRGNFADSWSWDAYASFGRVSQDSANNGYYYGPGLAQAVGPSFYDADGIARCGTPGAPIANCTPINFFGLDPSTAAGQEAIAALKALAVVSRKHYYQNMKTGGFNLTGDLFNLPAGAVSLAFGGEYRKMYSVYTPDFVSTITDPVAGTCLTFTDACASASTGELSVKEFYAEMLVPVLRDVPFAKSLNVNLGSRFSDYSAFDSTINSKIGIEWRPIDDLLFRGTIAEVFRAPTIDDLYGGSTPSADTYQDPCSGPGFSASNPACAGASAGFEQVTPQTSAVYGSNVLLKPEVGKSFTWGVVYDPSWMEGLSTSVDFWKIYLKNGLGEIGTQTIMDQCYDFGRFCDLFTRAVDGEIDYVNNTTQNIGRIDVSGIDFSIKYRLPETSFGNFRVGLDTTYFKTYNQQILQGDITTETHYAGSYFSSASAGPGNLTRWRGLGSLNWSMGDFDASWRARYIGSARFGFTAVAGDGYSVIDPTGDAANNSYRMGASTFHNLQFGYNLAPINTRFEVGVDNVGNKQPPQLWQFGFNGNTDERTYDVVGRYYWARVGVKF